MPIRIISPYWDGYRVPGTSFQEALADGVLAQDVAAETVVTSTGSPATSTGSWYRVHEPAGMTIYSDRAFQQLVATDDGDASWTVDFDGSPESIVASGYSGTPPYATTDVAAVRFVFTTGLVGGNNGGNLGSIKPFSGKEVVYLYWAWQLSDNWYGHSSNTNKQWFCDTSTGGARTFFNAYGSATGGLSFSINIQNHVNGSCGATSGFAALLGNQGEGVGLARGQWHEAEVVLTTNTPGNLDGRLEAWLNGVKTHDYEDYGMVDGGETGGFSGYKWSPIWGGVGGNPPETMYAYVAHAFMSAKDT